LNVSTCLPDYTASFCIQHEMLELLNSQATIAIISMFVFIILFCVKFSVNTKNQLALISITFACHNLKALYKTKVSYRHTVAFMNYHHSYCSVQEGLGVFD
jgi:hypothetical protein